MHRLSLVLAAIAGILAGALGFAVFGPAELETDEAAVRQIVSEMLAKETFAEIDPAQPNPLIESYLLGDPQILQRMSEALDVAQRAEQEESTRVAMAGFRDAIFNSPDDVVLGNPEGDVTIVEFFDYNCGYCRSALPDMATLLADDPNLKVILKEFPILSNESIDAARVAVLVGQSDVDYWQFHEALFSSRGKVDKAVALDAAADLGLSPVDLELRMGEEQVAQSIQGSYEIAEALGITGTPTYIIGEEVIPGAIGADELRARIADMRECGRTQCS